MAKEAEPRAPYVAPRYAVESDPAYYHVLHGAVPGHEMDFICSPPVPHGLLTKTHFAHVARLMRYMEPRDDAAFAFAIGNLSRDDVQHEPGHGGLALMFCARVEGVTDHAGRSMPSYAHCLLAIDRSMDQAALLEALLSLARRFSCDDRGGTTGAFYRTYVEHVREGRGSVEGLLAAHIAGFQDLPCPARSEMEADFVTTDKAPPERITVLYPEGAPFRAVATAAAAIGAVLYRSNVKWTSISDGREIEIPGGTSVRFVPDSEAPRDARGPVLRLDDIPEGDAEIAYRLFGARSRIANTGDRRGWRERYATMKGTDGPPADAPAGAAQDRGDTTRWGRIGAAAVAMASAAALLVTFAPGEDDRSPENGEPPPRPQEALSSPPSTKPEAPTPAQQPPRPPVHRVPATTAPPPPSKPPAKTSKLTQSRGHSADKRTAPVSVSPPPAAPEVDTPLAPEPEPPVTAQKPGRILDRRYEEE